ncbi:MAG: rod shape-determining protein MreD [Oscillospiraceae bacterium]|nr:rod shape-determining protein MreD [Oscillospiraceae bacterium]
MRIAIIKISLYILLIFLTFALQFLLPPVLNVRPLLLIMVCVIISLFSGPYIGGFSGFICGLICDWISVYTTTYYTMILMLFCIAVGLVAEYSLRKTLLSAYFLAIIVLVVTQVLFVSAFLLLFRRADSWAYIYVTTPEILYSLALLPILYFPARTIYRRTLIKR